jgi:hypothetical protein
MNYDRALARAIMHARYVADAHSHASKLAEGFVYVITADLARASTLALSLAQEMGLDLAGALSHAEELARAHAQARDLATELVRRLALTRVLHRQRSHGRHTALLNSLVNALDYVEDVSSAAIQVDHLVNGLARSLGDRCGDVGYGLAHVHVLDLPRGIRRLNHILQYAHSRAVVDVEKSHGTALAEADEVAWARQMQPGPMSRQLVAWAVRVLPAAQRPRYAEEFRAELWDLPQRLRIWHAFRILRNSWTLRRKLTSSDMILSIR